MIVRTGREEAVPFSRLASRLADPETASAPITIHPKLPAGLSSMLCTSATNCGPLRKTPFRPEDTRAAHATVEATLIETSPSLRPSCVKACPSGVLSRRQMTVLSGFESGSMLKMHFLLPARENTATRSPGASLMSGFSNRL